MSDKATTTNSELTDEDRDHSKVCGALPRLYRKAKRGEVTCKECVRSERRWWTNRTLSCDKMSGYAVGKNMTCRYAKKRQLCDGAATEGGAE